MKDTFDLTAYTPPPEPAALEKELLNIWALFISNREFSAQSPPPYNTALLSFKYARSAEISHAQLYSKMLAGIKTPKALSTVFLVCPTCGMVYSEQRTNPCELCNSQPDKFIRFEASR